MQPIQASSGEMAPSIAGLVGELVDIAREQRRITREIRGTADKDRPPLDEKIGRALIAALNGAGQRVKAALDVLVKEQARVDALRNAGERRAEEPSPSPASPFAPVVDSTVADMLRQ